MPVVLQYSYASSIIAQKDGIIALLNDSLNGGYFFSAYRWYRNGRLIDGANESYIIVGSDDLGAQYTALLTRTTDGVTVSACPIYYNGGQGLEAVDARREGPWMVMDMLGRVVMPLTDQPYSSTITTPGLYLIVFPYSHYTERVIIQ